MKPAESGSTPGGSGRAVRGIHRCAQGREPEADGRRHQERSLPIQTHDSAERRPNVGLTRIEFGKIALQGVTAIGNSQNLDDDALTRRIRDAPQVVFEGAQGVLLDERYGFHPHTTWSRYTAAGALELAGDRPSTRLGVVRAYTTRHGAGPFPTEDPNMHLPEPHTPDGHAGRFRVGALDVVLLRYALRAAPMDGLAVTCLDRVGATPLVCLEYEGLEELALPSTLEEAEAVGQVLRSVRPVISPCEQVVEAIERWTGVPVVVTASGPTAADRQWRLGVASQVATAG